MSDVTRGEWYAEMLASSLDLGLQSPDGLLEHATAAVLAEHLPREQLARVLAGALETGVMSPQHVVDTVGSSLLAACLPEDVVWPSVADAALRSGLARSVPAEAETLAFLHGAVVGGLARRLFQPTDLIRHANPVVLTSHLPTALAARLLQASLEAGRMSPELVVDTLGVEALARYLPASVLWACVCEVAGADAPGDDATAAIDLASVLADDGAGDVPLDDEELDLDDDLGGVTQDEADDAQDDDGPPITFAPVASLPDSFDESSVGADEDDPEEATVAVRTERKPAPTVSKAASALLAQAKRRARLGADKGAAGK